MEQARWFVGQGELGVLMRVRDWSQTPLGRVEDWPPALRAAVNLVLGAPQPVCLFWGPEHLALYNEGYQRLLGDQHPAALGLSARQGLAEPGFPLLPLLDEVRRTRSALSREDAPVTLERAGAREEAWFTFSCSPLWDEEGRCAGVWCFATETTRQLLAERRARLLRELSARLASAPDVPELLRALGEVLAAADRDVPCALSYRVEGSTVRRVLCTGLEPDAHETPPWPLTAALASPEAGLVEAWGAGEGVRAGPWPEPVRRALLLPLSLAGRETPDAVLGVGLSPRLPWDEASRDFLQSLVRQLSVELVRLRVESVRVRLAHLLEHAPAFVCALREPTHIFEFVNPLYRQLMGPHRQFLGLPVREALPEAAEQGLIDQLDAVYRTGQPFFGRDYHVLVDRHGTGQLEELFVNFVYQPRRDAHGQVEGIDVFGFEVTEQVLARQRAESLAYLLRQSEARQRRVVAASDAGLWELYLVSGRLTVDARTADLLDLEPGTFPTLAELLECAHEEDRERLMRGIFAALSGERNGHLVEVFRTAAREGSTPRWLECRGQRFQDADGRPAALAGAMLDVTEQQLARRRAEALAEQLRASEARRRQVVEASGAGLWELDGATGRITADARTMELLGMPVDSGIDWGTSVDRIHPEDREPVTRAINRALAGEDDGHYFSVFRVVGQDGVPERWVESRAQRLLSAEGHRVTLAGAMLDITERKMMELLRTRQVRLYALNARVGRVLARGTTLRGMLQDCAEALVDQLKAALVRIWLFDPTRHVLELEASDGLSTLPEDADVQLSGCPARVARIAQERRPYLTNTLQAEVPEGLPEDSRVGDPAWIRREKLVAFAGYPLLAGDRLVGVLAFFSHQELPDDMLDLLRQVADSIALGVERLRAEEALRTRVDFEQKLVGIVSHDLRNPLNAILLGANVLSRRDTLDAHDVKSLLRIRSSAERATRMVEDLLDFTQARLGGGLRLEPRPADLHEVTRVVVEEVETARPSRQLELRHEGEGRGLFDVDRLGQVVQNLVINALKYSPEDSRVAIVTRGDADGVSLTVSNINLGAPIPEDKLAVIFEPMQRATGEVDKVGRSVGLGLYIVKSIVEAHGGSISVVSTPEAGTVFTVRLPRARR